MSYLIDTDIIIYSLKSNEKVRENFLKNEKIPKYISVITYGELLYGAKKSGMPEQNLATVYRIQSIFQILEIDLSIIETFSDIKSKYDKKGIVIDDFDMLIAATALSRNYILVTNNIKHFSKIKELKIENWTR
jgi:tRNA(fMet)-specific endonuclease VapC